MIANGNEKYMVYAKVKLQLEGHGNQPPMRVDFREGTGGHFLDVFTILTDTDKVTSKDDKPLTPIAAPNNNAKPQERVTLNVVNVTDMTTDTEELEEYEDVIQVNNITMETRDDLEIQTEERDSERQLRWPTSMTIEQCMRKMQYS
jgi:hypothetical protein